MKVIVATSHTMESYENLSEPVGVFTTVDDFEDWLSENFLVVDVVDFTGNKFNTYYIHSKEAKTDDGGKTYYTEYEDDGEVYQERDVGDFVKLGEFEIVGEIHAHSEG